MTCCRKLARGSPFGLSQPLRTRKGSVAMTNPPNKITPTNRNSHCAIGFLRFRIAHPHDAIPPSRQRRPIEEDGPTQRNVVMLAAGAEAESPQGKNLQCAALGASEW